MEEHQYSTDQKDNLAQQVALVCLPHVDRIEIREEPVLKLYIRLMHKNVRQRCVIVVKYVPPHISDRQFQHRNR